MLRNILTLSALQNRTDYNANRPVPQCGTGRFGLPNRPF